ncbi:MRE11 [Scenedesmus sp. PABB004]|nr:MRE11 [Scenedesmus sp. PABB004]
MDVDGENTLRIMVSTDNHLGVWEKDEDRKHDSFRAFEEVLQLAVERGADMLLLGGDLFHDNKPSRATVIRTVELLHKYCLGDRPVGLNVLSDPAQNFVSGRANFLSPDINIALPVFTIHGNHDDPAGQDNLSAVDLLSSCALVNYFGKVVRARRAPGYSPACRSPPAGSTPPRPPRPPRPPPQLLAGNSIGSIDLAPVLIQKGTTKLALYGLGNVRDERLGRLFQTPNCVNWMRPASTPEYPLEDWLNIFVLHQNRVSHGAGAKNCLQERHLPAFMDLIIWGHEHECITELQPLQGLTDEARECVVLQPGSSVATALSEGESRPKHVFQIDLRGTEWRSVKLPLTTVRPFVWDTVALAAAQPPLEPEDAEGINAHLERKVAAMIQQAARDAAQQQVTLQERAAAARGAVDGGGGGGAAPPLPALLPLIRLRVDYTGFGTINSQRFGQKFVGKVANPHDMLLWAKASARRAKDGGGAGARDAAEAGGAAGALGLSSLRPEQLDQARIEDLVAANLTARLDILPPDELALALHDFVEKDERAALAACVSTVLTETQAAAVTRPGADLEDAAAEGAVDGGGPAPARLKDEDISNVVSLCVQSRQASRLSSGAPGGTPSAARGAPPPGGWAPDGMDVDGDGGGAGRGAARGGMPPPAPRGRQKRGAAAGGGAARQVGLAEAFARGSQQAGPTSPVGRTGSNLDGVLAPGDGGGTPSQGTSRSRAAASSARGARGRGRGRGRKAAPAALDSEEEFESEEGISDDDDDDEPPAKRARASPRPKRGAAKRGSYSEAADGDAPVSDDEQPAAPAPGRRGAAPPGGARRGGGGGSVSRGGTLPPPSSEQYSLLSEDEEEGISEAPSSEHEPIESDSQATAGGRAAGRAGGGRARAGGGGRAAGSQQTGGRTRGVGGPTPSQGTGGASIDGGFVDSDDDAAPPVASKQSAGGRRRVLPGSLAGGRNRRSRQRVPPAGGAEQQQRGAGAPRRRRRPARGLAALALLVAALALGAAPATAAAAPASAPAAAPPGTAAPGTAAPNGSATVHVNAASAGLLAALRDPRVGLILLDSNYSLGSAEFDAISAAAHEDRVKLTRNVTVAGTDGSMPLLDLGFRRSLVHLCGDCRFTFENLSIAKERRGNGAGIDLLQGEPGSLVVLRNSYRVRPVCTSTNSTMELIRKDQHRSPRIPAPDGSLTQWLGYANVTYQGTTFTDMLLLRDYAYDVPPSFQEGEGSLGGYTLNTINTTRLCSHGVPASCLAIKSPDTCVNEVIDQLLAGELDARRGPSAVVVGVAVSVAVAGALASAGLLALWLRARRRRRAGAGGAGGGGGGGATKGSGSCTGTSSGSPADLESGLGGGLAQPLLLEEAGWTVVSSRTAPGVTGGGGKIRFGACLGAGSYGRVYSGRWAGRDVAIKVIEHDSETAAAVENEVQLMLSFADSAHVVKAFHYVTWSYSGGDAAGSDAPSISAGSGAARSSYALSATPLAPRLHLAAPSSGGTPRAGTGAPAAAPQVNAGDSSAPRSSSSGSGSAVALHSVLGQSMVASASELQQQQVLARLAALAKSEGAGSPPSSRGASTDLTPAQVAELLAAVQQQAAAGVAPPTAPPPGAGGSVNGWALGAAGGSVHGSAASFGAARDSWAPGMDHRSWWPGMDTTQTSDAGRAGGADVLAARTKRKTWIVQELCDAGQLCELLLVLLELLQGAARGLMELHAKGVVHGDVNARNVLCKRVPDGACGAVPYEVKISDLGLSRIIKQHSTHRTTNTVGTLSHMSPELLRYGRLSPAVDIFAFGVMMWEIFTGKAAFRNLQYGMFFEQVVLRNARPPVPPDMPDDYAFLMTSAWATEPADRPTARQVLDCLALMLRSRLSGTPAPAPALAPALAQVLAPPAPRAPAGHW